MTELCGYTNRSVLQGHTYCCYICFVAHSVTCIQSIVMYVIHCITNMDTFEVLKTMNDRPNNASNGKLNVR